MPDQPLILFVKRNCLDDGPGIRTTVFFKGCPLDCIWCHNPEAKAPREELSYNVDECINCGTCRKVCLKAAIGPDIPGFVDRHKCNLCFRCVSECPAEALKKLGETMTVEKIISIVKRDIPFFNSSNGGITLSGGEPTMYMDFCFSLLQKIKQLGLHTLLETCGHFDFQRFFQKIYPYLDTIYFDLKIIDDEQHRRYCRVSNEKILANFQKLRELAEKGSVDLLPRIPLAPGITATDDNLSGIAMFLKECGVLKVALLPYNPTWIKKVGMLGKKPIFSETHWMDKNQLDRCRSFFSDFKLMV